MDGRLLKQALAHVAWLSAVAAPAARGAVRYLSLHSGLPALLVAALLALLGYRLLKKTARLAIELVAIAALLLVASELGWLRW